MPLTVVCVCCASISMFYLFCSCVVGFLSVCNAGLQGIWQSCLWFRMTHGMA